MNGKAILEAITMVLSGIRLLRTLGINYQQVIEAQNIADGEDRELTAEERQIFIDQAQDALNRL